LVAFVSASAATKYAVVSTAGGSRSGGTGASVGSDQCGHVPQRRLLHEERLEPLH
jgi:hypothetical protein